MTDLRCFIAGLFGILSDGTIAAVPLSISSFIRSFCAFRLVSRFGLSPKEDTFNHLVSFGIVHKKKGPWVIPIIWEASSSAISAIAVESMVSEIISLKP